MAVLLNPDDGPFKYCSPDAGHSSRLTPLPLDASDVALLDKLVAATASRTEQRAL